MIVCKEAYRDCLFTVVFDSPTTIVLFVINITQHLRNIVVVDFRIVLGYDTIKGCQVCMVFTVGILISGNLSVCNAQCKVGIGIESALLVPNAQSLHVGFVPFLYCRYVAQVAVSVIPVLFHYWSKPRCELHKQVVHNLFLCERIFACQLCCLKELVGKCFGTATLLDSLQQLFGNLACRHTADKLLYHVTCYFMVYFLSVASQDFVAYLSLLICSHLIFGNSLVVELQGKVECLNGCNRLVEEFADEISLCSVVVSHVHRVEYVCIFRLVLCPFDELCLVTNLVSYCAELFKTERFALPLFPTVGNACMLCRVCDTCSRVFCLCLAYDVKTFGAQLNLHRVRPELCICNGRACYELLCVAGESVYHCEVTLLYTFCRYLEMTLWTIRHILLAVFCRLVVGIGIHAEHREVTGVSWPYPVVGVATELAYR